MENPNNAGIPIGMSAIRVGFVCQNDNIRTRSRIYRVLVPTNIVCCVVDAQYLVAEYPVIDDMQMASLSRSSLLGIGYLVSRNAS